MAQLLVIAALPDTPGGEGGDMGSTMLDASLPTGSPGGGTTPPGDVPLYGGNAPVEDVVPGFGEDAGRALGLHPDVDALVFTGSTKVGKLFMTYAGTSNMKQVWLETGGKSPN